MKQLQQPLVVGVVLGLVGLAAAGLWFWQVRTGDGTVQIGDDVRVRVEVADTVASRERGLSGRDGLGRDEGMYFVFPAAERYTFWMHEMRFPIDIIWIADATVVDISADAQVPAPGQEPSRYRPAAPADRVLEVPAGYAKARGIRVGQPVREHIDKK